jgi:voltage-gated potassium channel Kch
MKGRFLYIVFAIISVILVTPFIKNTGLTGWLTSAMLIVLIPLASYFALSRDRRHLMAFVVLGAPFVVLDAVGFFYKSNFLIAIMYGFGTVLYLYIIVLLIRELLSRKTITAEMIYCAISIYLLIGIMWAGVYAFVGTVIPGSFGGPDGNIDYIYFSFVTLTTVGYGDVAPLTFLSKRLAVFEAAMGSIYMAIIVALIVGRYLSRGTNHNAE